MSISTSNNAGQNAVQELRELPVEVVLPNPSQPRRHFDEEALQALAGSIGERGVLQPVLVRPVQDGKYELVAGERRWRAAKLAGLQSIPALVRAREDAEALQTALIENMAREDLNPVEEARACVTLTTGVRPDLLADRGTRGAPQNRGGKPAAPAETVRGDPRAAGAWRAEGESRNRAADGR